MTEYNSNLPRMNDVLQYLGVGFSVIPIRPKDKRPTLEWKDYQKRLPTDEEVKDWWPDGSENNVAVVTGMISKLIVIDIDTRHGGEESAKKLHLLPTYIVKTGGGGWHYYYRWPHATPPPNLKGYLPGIDIQGESAYVVAPPSVHKSGASYEASNALDELTDAPEWLLSLGAKSDEKLWEKGIKGVSEGNRNETAASVCGKILASLPSALWEVAGWGGLKEWNAKNPSPLLEKELRAVFESIQKLAATDDEDDDAARSIALKVVDLVLKQKPTFFHDRLEVTYTRITIDGHDELHQLHSSRFKSWVLRQYWLGEKKPAKSEHIKTALDVLHSIALFEGTAIELANRVAKHDDALWYDLGDKSWRVAKITPNGWEIVNHSPALFRRFKHMSPQCEPANGGKVSDLLKYVNIADQGQQLLMLVYLVSCFVPEIPHPIPILHGSQGSAKSTFLRVLRRLVDPSATELLTFPTHKDQLVQLLAHHYAPYFDNVTSIPEWLSDALCRAVTGEGFSKRELYTNDEDVIYFFRCCIGLNGINVAATRADLLDRSILFGLERIPPDKRRDEEKFWKSFEQDRPLILGAVFETLAKAMVLVRQVELDHLPRMADFALWGCAIAEALGYTQNAFLKAYQANIDEQNEEALREHPVAVTVRAFMAEQDEWSGTSTQLLDALNKIAEQEKVDIRQKLWPKAAQSLSRRLNEAKTNLAHVGIVVHMTHGSNRVVSIRRSRNSVGTDGASNDGANANDGISATSDEAQTTLDLIRENLDPSAHFVD